MESNSTNWESNSTNINYQVKQKISEEDQKIENSILKQHQGSVC